MSDHESTASIPQLDCTRRTLVAGAAALAAAVALSSLGPVRAEAATTATIQWPMPSGARKNEIDGKQVLKCYAPSTNTVMTEILGLSNPSFYNQEYTEYSGNLATCPTLGVWGSSANAQPNVFYSNLLYRDVLNQKVDPKYTAVLGSALQGTSQQAAWDDVDGLPLFMKHRPEIYGITDADSWSSASKTTAELIKTINGFTPDDDRYQEGDESYNPSFVDFRAYYGKKLGYMYSMWEVAEAAQKILDADNTKTARYGSPLDQAAMVEKFMVGTQYAILQAIDEKRVPRRIVAVVGAGDNNSLNGVDKTCGRARIDEFEPSELGFDKSTQWGSSTARNVRYYHAASAMENVSDSIVTKFTPVDSEDLTIDAPIVRDKNGVLWARPEALMACDAIIVRTQTTIATMPGKDDLYELLRGFGYTDESKWPDIYTGFPQANGYGASNAGGYFWWYSYMLFVYPEVINPAFMSRYLLNNIYHIADSYTSDAMEITCGNMSLPRGYELSTAGYSKKAIDDILDNGIAWYQANSETVDKDYPNLAMTKQMAGWVENHKKQPEPQPQPVLKDPKVITGKSEYSTMCNEILSAWGSASTIVVVGSIYGAAIATPYAKQYGAPVVDAEAISKSYTTVKSMVKKLGAKKYIIVGNKSAVPSSVESKLKAMGLVARRKRITGTNNGSLSLAVAATKTAWGKTAVVCSTSDLMGLMGAAAYARAIKAPLFIVGKTLSSAHKKALKKFSSAVVVGSSTVVSSAVYSAIPCKRKSRISGTGSKLAAAMASKQLGAGMKATNSLLIAPSGKSSAIAAASVAGRKSVTLVPVYKANVATAAKSVLAKKPTMLTVAGASSDATNKLVAAAKKAIN
ncbi:MAG: hypothetical protein Q4D06_00815 [Coriobacteriia bacterium]|nr:hypothetical protein [Coriobacteriia bacterium]